MNKNNNVCLCKITKALLRRYFEGFVSDPILFSDASLNLSYEYSPERADAAVEKQLSMGREYLAVMVKDAPVGKIILKNIDLQRRCCTLRIHLQNDSVKDKGYGTKTQILAPEYAFEKLGMETCTQTRFCRTDVASMCLRRLDSSKHMQTKDSDITATTEPIGENLEHDNCSIAVIAGLRTHRKDACKAQNTTHSHSRIADNIIIAHNNSERNKMTEVLLR